MMLALYTAIIARMNADATLMGLMGKTVGDNPCYRAQRLSAIVPPAVTLHENTEGSQPLPGTDASIPTTGAPLATNTTTIQLDVWVSSSQSIKPSTGEDTDAIADRLDIMFLYNSIAWTFYDTTGARICRTFRWRRVSRSQQYEEDTGLWHTAVRYEFSYHILSPNYGLT